MRNIEHLIATAFRTFWRILFVTVFSAALAGGIALLVVYAGTQQWPPTPLTYIAAVAVAVLAAYAGGVTILMRSSVKGLLGTAKLAEHEAAAPLKAVGRELESRGR